MLHCSKNLPIMLYKCPYYAQTPVALCATLTSFSGRTSWLLFLVPVCGSVFTLTFHFHVNSNCLESQSLLSKEIGEEAVTSELLPVAQLSSTGG